MFRILLLLSVIVLSLSVSTPSSHAQQPWEDDYRRLSAVIPVTAREGAAILSAPVHNATVVKELAGPFSFSAHGFVESDGVHLFLTEAAYNQWLDKQTIPEWIRVNGKAEFPPLPRLIYQGKGIDPDTGEEARREVYEETVPINPISIWPAKSPAGQDVVLPVKVTSAIENKSGGWDAVFTVYPSFESNIWKFGFPEPSYNQLSDPANNVSRRLISKPDIKELTLRGSSGTERFLGVLKPGIVFNAHFTEGKLHYLEAGDNWPPVVAASHLSPPLFQASADSEIVFRFGVSTLDGVHTVIEVMPDKVTGADYTNYNMLAQFGPPFHEDTGIPEWTMSEWSIELNSDLTVHVVAPLMDGRGASGMLELEGLELGPSYEDEIKLMKSFVQVRPPNLPDAAGWRSIIKDKLGAIPAAQRIKESDGF